MIEYENDSVWMEFSIEGFQRIECPDNWSESLMDDPENYLVAADLSVSTTPAMAETEMNEIIPGFTVSFGSNWLGFTGDGKRINEIRTPVTYNCLDGSEELPWEIGPGEEARGLVVFEVPDLQGEVVYRPWYLDGGGWSWEFDVTQSSGA
ncbi:hypothetical protein AB0K08_01985 [Citricoccus sp. NPDC055426]|uniref:hypothetical protein n=1 Tax=Citricoccus sp. NPDC055426 TaxID=3155536 RepID=UPI003435A88F